MSVEFSVGRYGLRVKDGKYRFSYRGKSISSKDIDKTTKQQLILKYEADDLNQFEKELEDWERELETKSQQLEIREKLVSELEADLLERLRRVREKEQQLQEVKPAKPQEVREPEPSSESRWVSFKPDVDTETFWEDFWEDFYFEEGIEADQVLVKQAYQDIDSGRIIKCVYTGDGTLVCIDETGEKMNPSQFEELLQEQNFFEIIDFQVPVGTKELLVADGQYTYKGYVIPATALSERELRTAIPQAEFLERQQAQETKDQDFVRRQEAKKLLLQKGINNKKDYHRWMKTHHQDKTQQKLDVVGAVNEAYSLVYK